MPLDPAVVWEVTQLVLGLAAFVGVVASLLRFAERRARPKLGGVRDATGAHRVETWIEPLMIAGREVPRWQVERWMPGGPDHAPGVLLESTLELRLHSPPGHPGYQRRHAAAELRGLVERLGAGLAAWHDDQMIARLPGDAAAPAQRAAAARLVVLDLALAGSAHAVWRWLTDPSDPRSAQARAALLMDEAAGTPQAQAVAGQLLDSADPALGARAALVLDDADALTARATEPLSPGLRARVIAALTLHGGDRLHAALQGVPLKARGVRAAAVAALSALPDEAAVPLLARLWRAAEGDERSKLLAECVARGVGEAQAWEAVAAPDGALRTAGADALWTLLGPQAEAAAIERLVPGAAVTLGLCEALSRRGTAAAVPALLTVQRFEGPAAEAAGWAIADIQDRARGRGRQGGLALAGEGGGLALAGEAGGLTEVTE